MPVVINGSTGISGTDGSASTPAVQGTDTNTGLFFPAADTIAFAEGGTEVMRIDSAGNVGIGTGAPAYRLDVQGGAARVYRAGADALSVVENNSTFTSYTAYVNSTGTFDVGKSNGFAFLAANGAQPLVINTNASERMRISASGDVGIGTSSPAARLDVVVSSGATAAAFAANISQTVTSGAGTASNALVRFFGSNGFNTRDWLIGTGSPTSFGAHDNFGIRDVFGGTRLVIDTGGNVGIGTSSPGNRLTVAGSGQFTGTIGQNSTGTHIWYQSDLSYLGAWGPNSSTNGTLVFYSARSDGSNGLERARINASGQLLTTIDGTSSVMADYGCRAWVYFNGTGTVAINGSGNVSSITDNGTGRYTVNFATAMPDANYSVAGTCSNNDNNPNENGVVSYGSTGTYSASAVQVWTVENTGSSTVDVDMPRISVVIFR